MEKIHIWPEEHRLVDDQIQVNVRIEEVGKDQQQLWYRLGQEHHSAITKSSDPFVLALLFNAMRAPADLIVHGIVSPSLMQNLDEFQSAWESWRPSWYTRIEILADKEDETESIPNRAGVAAFSGGVDSSYTVYNHRLDNSSRIGTDLRAGLMLKGLDISLDKEDVFRRAVNKGQIMLDSIGMELIPMVTNLKWVSESWRDSFVVLVASGLSLLSSRYRIGYIPATFSYRKLVLPYGFNPITDPLMSSDSFRIIHDGAKYTRYEKIRVLGEWVEACQHLRVCFYPEKNQLNCCKCEKCIRTILGFRSYGLGLPPSFERDISNSQIRGVRYAASHESYDRIYAKMRGEFKSVSWVRALRFAIVINKTEQFLKRNSILRWIKGRLD